MSSKGRTRSVRALIVSVGAALLAVLLGSTGVLQEAELSSYDMRVRAFASEPEEEEETLLILVDQESLDWALETQQQPHPWPREYYSYITNFARRAGAASLSFDVLFTDDSFFGVGDDKRFAESVEAYGRVINSAFYGHQTGTHDTFPEYIDPSTVSVELEPSQKNPVPSFSRAFFPVPTLSEASARIGNVNILPDSDGVYRRASLLGKFDGRTVPILPLSAYLETIEEETLEFSSNGRKLHVGDMEIPLDSKGRFIPRFDSSYHDRTRLSAAAVIQSEDRIARNADESPPVDPEELEGRHVIVGYSAPGLLDLRPLPTGSEVPGVAFHAAVLDNLLSGQFIRQPSAVGKLVYAALLAFLIGFFASWARGTLLTALSLLLAPLVPVLLGVIVYPWWNLWLPIVVPAGASLAGAISAAVWNYATEGRERRFIKGAFSQYLSPAVIERLLEDPSRLQLGGERRELTIFFSDLQGFTSLSEELTPDELIQILNQYLGEMTDIVINTGGTVDKYEGDAIIAFWNAPLEVPEHPRVAVKAALQCQKRLAEVRPEFRKRIGKDLHMRIGLNTGEAVVGNMGSKNRFDYTMLGDAVNLAARLEGNNKQFGTYTMISGATASGLPQEIACRELGRIAVVGRNEPVQVFEPMYRQEYEAERERFDAFAEGLKWYYKGDFEQALSRFSELIDDPPAQAYKKRCEMLVDNPPSDWRGVWVMESK
ncbi:MAG: CHASE2 domain-containing protein [Spirochaetaceae bacterium]